MEGNGDKKINFYLSVKKIIFVIIYYVALNVLGIVLIIMGLLYHLISFISFLKISDIAIIGGIGASLVGCTIFYMRKIYKSCINQVFLSPEVDQEKEEIGILVYYLLRPIFAIGFSLLIVLSLRTGFQIVTIIDEELNSGYIYLVMLLSFFAGFSSGDILNYLDKNCFDKVTSIFK